ncbi:MAG: hypothetical protein BM557_01945 [Flavobacterium sp. MedPE-SWcel]|uniref:imelysin family protein n=1 Tax=uncultured Flavobacterium sp. TaxID=165435 RepID=UPI000910693B|nr:imelysin family protein [uncultured Flavobacterium sp.]OIQ22233.1 MAG: hypothetical protein BM557_01945 [Flavobacterium sp. MedPE-SWcel]
MKFKSIKLSLLASILVFSASCSSDDDNTTPQDTVVTKALVKSNYANIVYQSYSDSHISAVALQTAVNTFLADKTEANFNAVKLAWLEAREIYGQTEAYRECNGPIDTEGQPWSLGTEGQINAWPIEEAYIDYVQAGTEGSGGGTFDSSIIADESINIEAQILADLNEANDNAAAISTGWHAIEFLLWGQDNSAPVDNQAGQRVYTDYTTADNAERRSEYLQVVTNLLVSDMQDLVATWNTGGAYRTFFAALDEDIALKQAINGAFFIAGDELSSERMIAPVDSDGGLNQTGQEDEHSCFADNTHRDIVANAQGVYNVIFGKYGTTEGASFYNLVKQEDATQAAKLKAAADLAMDKVNAIANNAQPFDYLITQEQSTDNPQGPVMQAVKALQDLADEISASATVVGINL